MRSHEKNFAVLIVDLPTDRFRILQAGRAPVKGDLVFLDQGFTGTDGAAMVLVYGTSVDSNWLYEADVYEFEIKGEG